MEHCLMSWKTKAYYGRFMKFFRDIYERSTQDNIMGLGAEMSYYFILSFFPFLIFLIAVLSYTNITSEDFIENLSVYLPPDIYAVVLEFIVDTVSKTSTALLSAGALATVWAASNGISVLLIGINSAYDLEETRPFWKIRLLSIFFTFAIALIYISSLVMVVFGGFIARKIRAFYILSSYLEYVWNFFRYLIPIITIFIVFVIMYYYMPCQKIGIKKVIPGAIFSTLSWMGISQLFSLYVTHFGTLAKAYESLGGILILLIWIYWCGVAIMMGAELNATLYYFKKKKRIRV
jgi:membrane protein